MPWLPDTNGRADVSEGRRQRNEDKRKSRYSRSWSPPSWPWHIPAIDQWNLRTSPEDGGRGILALIPLPPFLCHLPVGAVHGPSARPTVMPTERREADEQTKTARKHVFGDLDSVGSIRLSNPFDCQQPAAQTAGAPAVPASSMSVRGRRWRFHRRFPIETRPKLVANFSPQPKSNSPENAQPKTESYARLVPVHGRGCPPYSHDSQRRSADLPSSARPNGPNTRTLRSPWCGQPAAGVTPTFNSWTQVRRLPSPRLQPAITFI